MQTGPEFLLSVSSYKGILYLENLGGVQLKEPPCITTTQVDCHFPHYFLGQGVFLKALFGMISIS